MTKREFLDIVFALAPTEANAIMDAFDEYVDSNEPHWIPVEQDTPKEAGTYMCTCYDAGRRIVTLVKWQPRTKTWNLTGARAYWKVIAWRKPFEPYKGVTDGRD